MNLMKSNILIKTIDRYERVYLSPFLYLFSIPLSLIIILKDINLPNIPEHPWILPYVLTATYFVVWNVALLVLAIIHRVPSFVWRAAIMSTFNSVLVLTGFSIPILYQIEGAQKLFPPLREVDANLAFLLSIYTFALPSILIPIYRHIFFREFKDQQITYNLVNYSITPLVRALITGELVFDSKEKPHTQFDNYEYQSVRLIRIIRTTDAWKMFSFRASLREGIRMLRSHKLAISRFSVVHAFRVLILTFIYLLILSPVAMPIIIFFALQSLNFAVIGIFWYFACSLFSAMGYLKYNELNPSDKLSLNGGLAFGLITTFVIRKNWLVLLFPVLIIPLALQLIVFSLDGSVGTLLQVLGMLNLLTLILVPAFMLLSFNVFFHNLFNDI